MAWRLPRHVGGYKVDWREVAAIIEDAYRQVAPKMLIAQLDKG